MAGTGACPPKVSVWSVLFALFFIACGGPAPPHTGAAPAVRLQPAGRSTGGAPSDEGGGRWSFVVFGDTRDATQDTRTGISPFLPALAAAIAPV